MSITVLTKDNFEAEVLKSGGTVLVDFYADWCGPCKMQAPIIDEVSRELGDVKFCKINIDEQPELAMEYGVMSIPTIMVVKKGEVTFQEPGLLQKKDIEKLLK